VVSEIDDPVVVAQDLFGHRGALFCIEKIFETIEGVEIDLVFHKRIDMIREEKTGFMANEKNPVGEQKLVQHAASVEFNHPVFYGPNTAAFVQLVPANIITGGIDSQIDGCQKVRDCRGQMVLGDHYKIGQQADVKHIFRLVGKPAQAAQFSSVEILACQAILQRVFPGHATDKQIDITSFGSVAKDRRHDDVSNCPAGNQYIRTHGQTVPQPIQILLNARLQHKGLDGGFNVRLNALHRFFRMACRERRQSG